MRRGVYRCNLCALKVLDGDSNLRVKTEKKRASSVRANIGRESERASLCSNMVAMPTEHDTHKEMERGMIL